MSFQYLSRKDERSSPLLFAGGCEGRKIAINAKLLKRLETQTPE